ncbi:MAG: hypothetical protein Q9187_002550 [Circinaria calcarea]
MAKSRSAKKHNSAQTPRTKHRSKPQATPSPTDLLKQATALLQTGQPASALPLAEKALSVLQSNPSSPPTTALPALTLLGEIYLEIGSPAVATTHFLRAVDLDPHGLIPEALGGCAEKFLWLAQLSEEGGEESVRWFERGVAVLRREMGELEERLVNAKGAEKQEIEETLEEKRRKIAGALCGIVEVYMTDLSWDPSAESHCETHITTALLLAPSSPTPLQTLASVRLSQFNLSAARSALTRSLALWTYLPPSHPLIPDYPTRISLARLLMEAEMEEEALEVLERLVGEDDESVEAWYLGGWCLWLLGGKEEEKGKRRGAWVASREWLREGLRLYEVLKYEDERLQEHAAELVGQLDEELGEGNGEDEDEDEDEGDEEWEDEDVDDKNEEERKPDEDHEMEGT